MILICFFIGGTKDKVYESFDRETKSLFTFLVFAYDGRRTGSATVKIIISDVNDKAPEFTDGPYIRYVLENQKSGAFVGFVTAKDKDEGSNALITYSLIIDAGRFTINVNTGLIRTIVKLDRESNDNEFKIRVAATDQGIKSLMGTVEVIIKVTDANDQYPYFTRELINARMSECVNIGDRVTTVSANDNDEGINAELMYSITSGNTPRRFRIDPDNGRITVAHRLDYEKEKKYKLYISVRDKGLPQLISKRNASISINMDDCNDNAPVFTESSYVTTVREDTSVGTIIFKVTASDDDIGENGQFDFFTVDPDEKYQFIIRRSVANGNVGIVTLVWKLDREKKDKHILKIGARDRGNPSLTGYAQLVVIVEDVNDNGPVFIPSDFCGIVKEEETGEQTVAIIQVTDPDGKGNQCPCNFSIVEDPTGYFVMKALPNGDKAVIKTKSTVQFDRDVAGKQLYKLKISATDSGKPRRLTSSTYVYVTVLDKNDNVPYSGGKLNIKVNAYKGDFIGGSIGKVYIVDNDCETNDIYKHSYSKTTSLKYFSFSSNGNIVMKKSVPAGSYELDVQSNEKNAANKKTVTSSVTVSVKEISEKVVKSSLAIRMTGLTKDLTCKELKYPDFEQLIADILGVDVTQVILFSAMEVHHGLYRGVDIRFSVLKKKGAGSFIGYDEYYSKIYLIMKLSQYKERIERETGK